MEIVMKRSTEIESKRLIGLCQSAYIEKILKRFYMKNSKCGTIPTQEKLKLSKSLGASTPAEIRRITAVKNIMKYLRNTKDMFLVYRGDMKRELRVFCYTDAKYLTDADDMKSQTGYVFVLNGGVVDWKSTKQSIFATSSIDAEYITVFYASKEAVWIRKFISGLGVVPTIEEPINMYFDNIGAITIAKDHGVTKGARHFPQKFTNFQKPIRNWVMKRIEKVDTNDNLADPFTKALVFPKHSELTEKIRMISASSHQDQEVFSTWMAFGGNTRDLGSFGEETDEITDLHQIHKEILFSERGDDVAGIKRCRRDPSSDGVRDLVMVSRRGLLNEDLESST
ncbi:hypothetical protein Tco_0121875 [Tanacetum coccineum]